MKFQRSIWRTPLFKVGSLSGLSLVLKIAAGLITSKVLAVFVGPQGIALVGNLRNFLSAIETTATLGFQNGIVKYIAEQKNDPGRLRRTIDSVFYVLLGVALLFAALLWLTADWLNGLIFGSGISHPDVFKVLALALPWYVVSVVMMAVLNGLGKFRDVIRVNIIGNLIGLVFSVAMVMQYRTFGALLAIVVPPALLFFTSYYYLRKRLPHHAPSRSNVDFAVLKGLLPYALMALVSSVLSPLVYLALRNFVIAEKGLKAAGYLEAMTRISGYYMLFVTTLLGLYFLPKLAEAAHHKATHKIFISYYSTVLPLFTIGMVVLYLLRDVMVRLLFSADFASVAELFFWQLIGDVFKTAALILGYQFFAKKLTKAFIATEILSLVCMYALTHYLVGQIGVEGYVMAHALNYALYLLVLLVYFRKPLFAVRSR